MLARRQNLMGPNAPLFYRQPLVLARAKGVWLHDVAGRKYLDAYNNVAHVGHGHPAVVKAVQRQMARLNTHTRYLDAAVLDYHERLLDKFPRALGSVVLTCTGSEANDLALRIARLGTGHQGVIVTDWTYHGNTASVSEISSAYNPRPVVPHVRYVRAPQAGGDFVEGVRRAIAYFRDSGIGLAAMLIDPVFSTDGLQAVPKGQVKQAVALVRAAGGLYIADEVQSGFGRLGRFWWGFQSHGVVPDLVTLGKAMGNGYPLAGVVGRRKLIADFRREVMYFNTFGAGHAACAAGRAVLEVIEAEDLLANARSVGAALADDLRALKDEHSCIGEVRGQGFFLGVEIVRGRDDPAPDAERTAQVVERMKDAGVLVSNIGRHDNVLKIRPPMPFAARHARLLVRALDQSLRPAR
ncbi:MAG: aspartate aminotransferase family protein [Burkholderiales bacterium]|nr:aspartate aminotransferase family protein [Burkholderiales bacterium]MDE2453987.1 aspartate aminotransferase family protein [Burkholderiales bacterium]